MPRELLSFCPPGARIVDTAPLSLDEINTEFERAHVAGEDVARLHSGDLSIYSALAEQLRRLKQRGIPYTLTPGVPAFAAAAAALECELTVPEVAQSVVLTRVSGRASRMPETEKLAAFAATGATLAIHLAIHAIDAIVKELTPFYSADCPAAVVVQASSPTQRIIRGTLADIAAKVAAEKIERTALILVGRALAAENFRDSALYDADYRQQIPRRRGVNTQLETFEWRAADQILFTVEHHNLDSDVVAGNDLRRRFPRRQRYHVAERDAFGLCVRKSLRRGVGGDNALGKLRRAMRPQQRYSQAPPDRRRRVWNADRSGLARVLSSWRRRMRHDGDTRHRMAAQIFQHAADEVAHVDQRNLGKIVELLRAGLGAGTGRPAVQCG